jgi:aryl-alcohol dehydrogenase-like predicted oxidoreductase
MQQTNRREFLRNSLALGAAAAFPAAAWSAAPLHANDVIELGPAKVKVSRLAMGTGTFGGGHSSNQMRKLGADGVADLWWDGFDNGLFFWDCADSYGSHAAVKLALKKIPREKVAIQSKTTARTADAMKADLDRFRQEMGTDYIDILLLHSRMSSKWDELDKGPMDVLSEAKEKKIVRTMGISCHSVGAMEIAIKSPWLEVCLARINPMSSRMDATTPDMLKLLARLRAAGKGIIGMKILAEGQMRDRVDEALRFTLTEGAVDAFTIGMESRAELKDMRERIIKNSQPA